MKKKLYIITGASRGIGLALAKALCNPGHHLVCIARTAMDNASIMEAHPCEMEYIQKDLSDIEAIANVIPDILSNINPKDYQEINLINNAAMLEPIGPCGSDPDHQIKDHIHLNLLSPMILTSAFIHFSRDWTVSRTILNISSGAGSNPYFGWSAYCTSKAGIDMFTRCVGLEQQSLKNGVRLLSIAPGVVDTQMQETIRSTDSSKFPDRERFIRLKENAALRDPMDVAQDLLRVLDRTNIPNGSVLDLRDLDT